MMMIVRRRSCKMCGSRNAELFLKYTGIEFDVIRIDKMWSSSVPRNTDVNVGSKYNSDKDGSSSDKEDSGDFGSAKAHNLSK